MEYKLQSDTVRVTIQSKGAEISSIILNDLEYIWQAKPDVWSRHAPVLFPIVGKLKKNSFHYNSNSYSLPQHGFARDKEFKVIEKAKDSVTFELVNDPETEKVFPFQFQFFITYEMEADRIFCSYKILNPSITKDLFFSVGAHPGFRVPLLDGEKFSDYSLFLDPNKKYCSTVLMDGLLTDTKKNFDLSNGEIKISDTLFDDDALVFEDSQIDSVVLKSNSSGHGVEMNCKNWPYFGIWSKKGNKEFICLEPWHGIADSVNSEGDFKLKKGIIHLEPQEEFNCGFSIQFF